MMDLSNRDTGRAKLPGLTRPATGNASLDAFLGQVAERLEVREGARGNDDERVVTQRELKGIQSVVSALKQNDGRPPAAGQMQMQIGGLTATLAIRQFEDMIRGTKLYQDLKKRLDDPSRFDDLPQALRDQLTASIAEQAARAGASITRVERISKERFSQLAIRIDQVTAAVDQAASGVRETAFASAEANRAQAGKIVQLEASLGNYYQDGQPGRVRLEEQMTATVDKVQGLRGQYTLKVQAGGALAGFGLAAEEVDGRPSSAFIIAADKFAIVNPLTYSAGLTNTPDTAHVPFGVDAKGIYLNHNVYIKGNMRIDAGGKTLMDGMRGSMAVASSYHTWSDNVARQAIWRALGKPGAATDNNHIVIGDTVTMGQITRQWMGDRWETPGAVFNGSMLVDGTVAASKIDTRGLDIRDQYGNVIFSAGTPLSMNRVQGLRGLAGKDAVTIGQDVRLPDGTTMNTHDFVNRLSRINSRNISVFMEGAAIGNAYIGNAAVGTLNIAGASVTSMSAATNNSVVSLAPGQSRPLCTCFVDKAAGGSGVAIVAFVNAGSSGNTGLSLEVHTGGVSLAYSATSILNGFRTTAYVAAFDASNSSGVTAYTLYGRNIEGGSISVHLATIMATGGKR